MDVLRFDEAQGLTAEMVRAWAESKGWRYSPAGLRAPNGGFAVFSDPSKPHAYPWIVERIAIREGRSLQSVLRDINPRLRLGLPSRTARLAHGLACGLWLAQPDFDSIGAVVCIVVSLQDDEDTFSVWHPRGFEFSDGKPLTPSKWRFWPCDEHGNKVLWPERDGVML